MNTYTVKTRRVIPENWCSGTPVRFLGVYLYTVWKVAKEGYQWQCNRCFSRTVKHKHDICDACIISKAELLIAKKAFVHKR